MKLFMLFAFLFCNALFALECPSVDRLVLRHDYRGAELGVLEEGHVHERNPAHRYNWLNVSASVLCDQEGVTEVEWRVRHIETGETLERTDRTAPYTLCDILPQGWTGCSFLEYAGTYEISTTLRQRGVSTLTRTTHLTVASGASYSDRNHIVARCTESSEAVLPERVFEEYKPCEARYWKVILDQVVDGVSGREWINKCSESGIEGAYSNSIMRPNAHPLNYWMRCNTVSE